MEMMLKCVDPAIGISNNILWAASFLLRSFFLNGKEKDIYLTGHTVTAWRFELRSLQMQGKHTVGCTTQIYIVTRITKNNEVGFFLQTFLWYKVGINQSIYITKYSVLWIRWPQIWPKLYRFWVIKPFSVGISKSAEIGH